MYERFAAVDGATDTSQGFTFTIAAIDRALSDPRFEWNVGLHVAECQSPFFLTAELD